MEIWKEFEANELTHSSAHYLMAVYELLNEQGYARSADIAKHLGIARSSASMSIHLLIDKGYLKEDKNKFIQLTPNGKQLAEEIIGKKVVLKRFLQDILKVKPHQAEIDTCKIEHLISSETGASLLAFLRFMSSEETSIRATLEKFWKSKEELMPSKLKAVK
ncbi:MAG: metal-dependent transcriptional regulator [Deltaproteobacteria bacterium]|nr:metal-dependent transcriptional regulator [Deltaproteobacteria bacterium]